MEKEVRTNYLMRQPFYHKILNKFYTISNLDLSIVSFIKLKKVVIKIIPVTIIKILPGKYSEFILNNTLVLNQVWKGRPTPSKTAKKRTLLFQPLPFIFLIELLTNILNKPKPQPTMKNTSKNIFIASFVINDLEIAPNAIKSMHDITIYDFFKIFSPQQFIFLYLIHIALVC